jgi:hypothetical protein
MNYNNIVDKLLDALPEVKPMYEKELDWWDEILPHIVFGDVFNQFLFSLLREDCPKDTLIRVFLFLEKMAVCPDKNVQGVLGVSVLEQLGDDPILLERSTKYMGEATKKISDEIEEGLGRR